MAGYNHFSDCLCGWCNYGPGDQRFNSLGAPIPSVRLDELRTSFLNKNARCPECNANVYYFENSFGSRVFFDDVGRPWPKHSCTDNTRVDFRGSVSNAAQRRGLSESQLTILFNASRLRFSPVTGNVRELYIVIEKRTKGSSVLVKSRSLTKPARKGVFDHFLIVSPPCLLALQDTFATAGPQAFFIDPISLELCDSPYKRLRAAEYHQ
jgi:hypothetical protein